MPSSYVDSIPNIVHTLIVSNPKRILDVGPGWGKYGLLCREYLSELETLDAIEVEPSLKPIQQAIYDNIIVKDVRDIPDSFWKNYDMILMIDIIEHIEKDQGKKIVAEILSKGCQAIISTPKLWFDQAEEENPYERHRSFWTWEDFPSFYVRADISTIDSLIYFLGRP